MVESGADKQPYDALAGLPVEVKVLASEMDNVVSLEELAMRSLHHIYQQPTGVELLHVQMILCESMA